MLHSPLILFVNPRPSTWYTRSFTSILTCPPLGLLYLAAYLRAAGFEVDVIDLMVNDWAKADLASYLEAKQPHIVGVTCTTEASNSALRLCKFVKDCCPSSYTVLGGPHPTFEYGTLLSNPQVDFVIRREGELAMEGLARALVCGETELEHIQGLCWKQDGQIIANEAAPFIANLDELPLPARDLLDVSQYVIPGAIATSRGCPAQCNFCAAGALAGGQYRCRSARNVYAEIEYMVKERGIRNLYFVDDTFTGIRKRAIQICQMIIDAGLDVEFACESRVNVVDLDFLRLLKQAGCQRIQFGVESGSDEILARIRKGITTKQVRNAFAAAREAGLNAKGSFIIGHVWDTRESALMTMDLMRELHERYQAEVYPAVNIPFPGTGQYENRDELGLHLLSSNWDDYYFGNCVIDTPHLSHLELKSLYFEAAGYAVDANARVRASERERA